MTVFDRRRRAQAARKGMTGWPVTLCCVDVHAWFLKRGVIGLIAVLNSAGITTVCNDVLHKAAKMATVHCCIL